MKKYSDGKIKKNVIQVFYAILAALIIRSFFFEPFSIPSGSMYPNLKLVIIYLFQNILMVFQDTLSHLVFH